MLYSVAVKMNMSEVTLHEDDFNLQDFFPKAIPYHLQTFIEYRVKLILKENTTFNGGEIKFVNTCIKMNGKVKGTKLSMFLIPTENMVLDFQSGGYISSNYKGRVLVKLGNYSNKTIKLQSGTPVGYIVMTPYSLEM